MQCLCYIQYLITCFSFFSSFSLCHQDCYGSNWDLDQDHSKDILFIVVTPDLNCGAGGV